MQDSEDIRYMVSALKTLQIPLEEHWEESKIIVQGCGGHFPLEGENEIGLSFSSEGETKLAFLLKSPVLDACPLLLLLKLPVLEG